MHPDQVDIAVDDVSRSAYEFSEGVVLVFSQNENEEQRGRSSMNWWTNLQLASKFSKGKYLYDEGLFHDALPALEAAAKSAQAIENWDVAAEALELLAEIFESKGQKGKVLSSLKKALEYREKMGNTAKIMALRSLLNPAPQGVFEESDNLAIEDVVDSGSEVFSAQDESSISKLNQQVRALADQGQYRQALHLAGQVHKQAQEHLDPEHVEVATSLYNLAWVNYLMGKFDLAKPIAEQALAMTCRLVGGENRDIARSINLLAMVNHQIGQYGEAESLFKEVLEMDRRLLGNEDENVATTLSNLAALYMTMGRYSEALSLLQEAVPMLQRLLGVHRDVATGLDNLAALYHFLGQVSEAIPWAEQGLAMWVAVLGKEHPDVAVSMNNLVAFYLQSGFYAKAEPLAQEALALKRRLFGDSHPSVATSFDTLGGLYFKIGQHDKAQLLYQEALSLSQQLQGNDHPVVARCLRNLARVYRATNREDEAVELEEKAARMRSTPE